MGNSAAKIYQTQEIMSASPVRLVAMLYDRAISSLREAVRAIDAGDIQARCNANRRAYDILHHLDMTLDVDKGGKIAENLSQIYAFVLRLLPKIDFDNDKQAAEQAIRLLEPLRDSWRELAAGGKDADTAPAAPSYGQPQPASGPARSFTLSA